MVEYSTQWKHLQQRSCTLGQGTSQAEGLERLLRARGPGNLLPQKDLNKATLIDMLARKRKSQGA